MNNKTFNYSLTVVTTKQEAFWLVDKLAEDFSDLFTKESTINIYTVEKYKDMIVVDMNLKNVNYKEVEDFEDELIRLNLLGEQWKILKECNKDLNKQGEE